MPEILFALIPLAIGAVALGIISHVVRSQRKYVLYGALIGAPLALFTVGLAKGGEGSRLIASVVGAAVRVSAGHISLSGLAEKHSSKTIAGDSGSGRWNL